MSKQFTTVLHYNRSGRVISVSGDPKLIAPTGMPNVANGFDVIVESRALLDTTLRTIYVRQQDFRNYNLLYVINGVRYKQRTGMADAYGIIKGNFQDNNSLRKTLKEIGPCINDYDVRIYKGLEAYRKFGYLYVFGVIELSLKQ
jgi:hypothetical protein